MGRYNIREANSRLDDALFKALCDASSARDRLSSGERRGVVTAREYLARAELHLHSVDVADILRHNRQRKADRLGLRFLVTKEIVSDLVELIREVEEKGTVPGGT